MRAFILLIVVSVASMPVWAAERDTKAALSLALAQTVKAKQSLAECGKCRLDETEARADALAEQKPVALFVGVCHGLGDTAVKAGAVPIKVAAYEHDGRAADRVVILEPKPDGSGFMVIKTIEGEVKADDLKKAIAEAKTVTKGTKKKLDWNN